MSGMGVEGCQGCREVRYCRVWPSAGLRDLPRAGLIVVVWSYRVHGEVIFDKRTLPPALRALRASLSSYSFFIYRTSSLCLKVIISYCLPKRTTYSAPN